MSLMQGEARPSSLFSCGDTSVIVESLRGYCVAASSLDIFMMSIFFYFLLSVSCCFLDILGFHRLLHLLPE